MSLALKELQEGLPDQRGGPFLLRHPCDRRREDSRCAVDWNVGCCARAAKKGIYSRRPLMLVLQALLGSSRKSSKSEVTQADSQTDSSQIIHPRPLSSALDLWYFPIPIGSLGETQDFGFLLRPSATLFNR